MIDEKDNTVKDTTATNAKALDTTSIPIYHQTSKHHPSSAAFAIQPSFEAPLTLLSEPTAVNFRTANVDASFRPVSDPRVKREIRELQRGETITLWQHGIDRDGDANKPRAWKLYDPDNLPMVYQNQYHDSEGVNGFPGNVIPGGRAMVALLNAGVTSKPANVRLRPICLLHLEPLLLFVVLPSQRITIRPSQTLTPQRNQAQATSSRRHKLPRFMMSARVLKRKFVANTSSQDADLRMSPEIVSSFSRVLDFFN
jgi:hypothetical protein